MIIIKDFREVADEVRKHLKEYLELNDVKFKGRDFNCINEAHKDKHPSSGLTKDGLAFACKGCDTKGDIFSAYRIFTKKEIKGEKFFYALKELADLFYVPYVLDDTKIIKHIKEKEYIYENSDGVEVYKIERFHKENENGNIIIKENGKIDKAFYAHTKVEGVWEKGMKFNTRYIYNLPQVNEAIRSNQEIYLVEGEKCADILNKEFGITATTIPFGSNSWKEPYINDYKNQLKNAKVVLIPDNDKGGYQLMNDILRDIKKTVKSIKIVNLNNDIPIQDKGDIEQWMELGGTKDRLIQLVQGSKDLSDTIKPWYIKDEKGNVKINRGLLAKHLIENYPSIHCAGQFYLYNNGVYKVCKNEEVQGIIKSKIEDKYLRMNIIKDAQALWKIDDIINKKPEMLNSCQDKINVKNGIYVIADNKLVKHEQHYLTTIQYNVEYDSNASGTVFEKFLDSIVPEQKSQMLLQEIAGYTMSAYTKAKKFFILQGPRDSGKTTFLNLISTIIGEENLAHVELQELNNINFKSELFGKIANISTELPDKGIMDTGSIKALLGQDAIHAKRLYEDPFSFYNKAKLLFSCNNLPKNFGDKSDAFYNKMIIVRFNKQLTNDEIDVMLPEKLELEKAYVFMWAMQGLRRLIENDFRFTETDESKELVEQYKVRSNNVLEFVKDCCVIEPDAKVTSVSLQDEYNKYCKDNNYTAIGRNGFKAELESSFSGKIISKLITNDRLNGYIGIRLK